MSTPARTHYDVLGIARDADADEVRRAWKLLVQAWHPDRFTGDAAEEAEQRAADINAAYHALRDSGRRAAYDCKLAADEAAAAADTQSQRARRQQPAPPTRSSDRVGAPHVHAVSIEPEVSPLDQLSRDVVAIIRRYPKLIAAVAACWVLFIGGAVAWSAVRAPELPAPSAAHPARPTSAMSVDVRSADEDVEEFRALAEQAKREADAYDAQVAKQMAADAAAQERADRLAEAQARAAAAKAAKSGKAKPRGRVVRVMPGSVPPGF